ncbi:predicted protein [Plenodomus lingam JN3]|uniref:Predicted protein n=1 Tax=Leptosphaeria maculans (strain JN3 / isolate v23.1.3 / race Av1-4-5-6-7-8) TaxID=985895 RepID=E4ZS19_LEPMJ|nr:predicted protein [Plenodomus lingam JN3]CBX94199.1 predicted protein [Plenodomus lingam JN3]
MAKWIAGKHPASKDWGCQYLEQIGVHWAWSADFSLVSVCTKCCLWSGPRKLFSEAILVGPTESRFVLGLHLEPPASKIFVVSVFSTPFVFCAPLRRLHPLSWLNAHHEGDRNNGKSAAAGSPHGTHLRSSCMEIACAVYSSKLRSKQRASVHPLEADWRIRPQ